MWEKWKRLNLHNEEEEEGNIQFNSYRYFWKTEKGVWMKY